MRPRGRSGRGHGIEPERGGSTEEHNDRPVAAAAAVLPFHPRSLPQLGDAVPQTPWDFSLCRRLRQGASRAVDPTARPAVCLTPVGAQVASPQSPILRRSTASLRADPTDTRGADHYSTFARTRVSFCQLRPSPFARTATGITRGITRGTQGVDTPQIAPMSGSIPLIKTRWRPRQTHRARPGGEPGSGRQRGNSQGFPAASWSLPRRR